MYRLILLMAICVTAVGVVAAGPTWNNRVWLSDSGLVDNRVIGVKQSSDGFLWVATARGVMRFDGLEFRALAGSADLTSAGKIYAIFMDSLDRLWVAKQRGEILCVDHGSVVITIPPGDNGQYPGFPSIVEEQPGQVIFRFPNGDFFRVRDGKAESLTEAGSVRNEKGYVVKDGLGQIWFSQGREGFGMIKGSVLCFLETLQVDQLAGARSGGVWICSSNELWRYTQPSSLKKICSLPVELGELNQNAFYEDRRGGLWLGSDGSGLLHFDGQVFAKVPSTSRRIKSIDEDMEGNVWVGTGDGLSQLTPAVTRFLPSGDDTLYENALSVCEDKDGFFWVVWSSGLISKSLSTDPWGASATVGNWSKTDAEAVPLAQCAVADSEKGVWFGTKNSGLYCWQNGGVTTNLGIQNGLADNDVNALHMTQDGTLWIGTENSRLSQYNLQCWQSGRLQSFALPPDAGMITAMTSDSDSDCWCATYGGYLFRVGHDGLVIDETASLYPGQYSVISLCTTPDGSLWIGFSGQGLGRLKDGRLKRYRTDQGLHEDFISRILFDGSSRLWFAGNRGVFSVRLDDFDAVDAGRSMLVQSVVYGTNEGLPISRATDYFWPGAMRDSAGRLLFGMSGGVAVINPEDSSSQRAPPAVVVDRVRVDGRTIASFGVNETFQDSTQTEPFELRQHNGVRLRIPPGSRHLEISFTALSFKMPESIHFKCRLDGLSHEWNDMGSRRSVSYYGISPGDYQFQVIACNSDGVWNETGTSIALTLESYWWETVWFRAGGSLLAVSGLLAGILFFLRRRQKFQIERLELQQATGKERSRIAADLHDEMGSNLAHIGLLCERAKKDLVNPVSAEAHLDKALANSRMLSEQLDAVIWAVDPANDTLEKFIEYVGDYAQEFLALADVRLRLAVPEELPLVTLSSTARHQLFLAVKEALHNVEKHACATLVTLRISLEADTLAVEVEDNGRGMDKGHAAGIGADGLSNMTRRMEGLRGRFESLPGTDGQGTRIIFTIPMALTDINSK